MVADDDWDAVSVLTMQFAGMLRAGLAPVRAWALLIAQDSGRAREVFGRIERRNAATLSESLKDALDIHAQAPGAYRRTGSKREAARLRPWREFVAMLTLAEQAGLPLAFTLDELAATAAERADHQRQLQVLLQSPRSSARVLMIMPIVGVLFGLVLNGDAIRQGVTSVVGITGICIAILLMIGSWVWSARMLASLDKAGVDDRMQLEILSLALRAPGGGATALQMVRTVLSEILFEDVSDRVEAEFSSSKQLSETSGMPLATLIGRTAKIVGSSQLRALQQRSKALEIKLLFPLGLMGLPAFLIVTVVPFMVGLFASTGGVFG